MLSDGLKLMVIGMGTVLVFLSLMSLIIQLSHKVLAPFNHLVQEKQPAAKPRAKAPAAPAAKANDGALVAAVSAAVKQYRDEHK